MIKRNIFLMYAIAFFTGMVFYASISTLYRQYCGVSIFQITIIESVSFVLCLLLEIPFGVLADRIGYKKIMILSMFLYAFSKFIFWKADSFWLFLLERIVLSFSLAGLSGVDESIIYLSCTEEKSQKIFGIHSSFGTAGLLCASALFSIFSGEDYRMSALWTLITYSIAAMLSLFLIEVKAGNKESGNVRQSLKNNFQVLKRTVLNKKLLFITIGCTLFGESMSLMFDKLNQVKYDELGMSPRVISLVYIAFTLVELFSFASDFFTKLIGRKFFIISSFFTGIICVTVFAFTHNAFIAVGVILFYTFISTLTGPLLSTIYNENITEEDRASALSMLSVITDFGSVLVQLSIGKMADISLTFGFLWGIVICLIGTALFFMSGIIKKEKSYRK